MLVLMGLKAETFLGMGDSIRGSAAWVGRMLREVWSFEHSWPLAEEFIVVRGRNIMVIANCSNFKFEFNTKRSGLGWEQLCSLCALKGLWMHVFCQIGLLKLIIGQCAQYFIAI